MKVRDHLEYAAVRGLLALCRVLPEGLVFGLFRGIGILSYHLISRRRITAYMNTGVVYPDWSRRERMQLVRTHFLYMADSLAMNTMMMSGRITDEQLLDMVDAEGWERLEATVRNSPKGMIIFSGHSGNWELMPQYITLRLGMTTHIITRKTNNPLIEKNIMRPMRERFGIQVFYKKNALRTMLQAARKREPSGMLVDQKLNLHEGIAIDFFGRPAGTTATPAVLQIRFGIVALPVFMVHAGRRRYKLVVGEVTPWEDTGAPFEEQVARLTALHQKSIEDIILAYPEQWFWVHDRWELWKKRKKP